MEAVYTQINVAVNSHEKGDTACFLDLFLLHNNYDMD